MAVHRAEHQCRKGGGGAVPYACQGGYTTGRRQRVTVDAVGDGTELDAVQICGAV